MSGWQVMLNYQDAHNALMFLVETDESAAKAKSYYQALEDAKKTIEAYEFSSASGSAAERKQKALASDEYLKHLGKIEKALLEYETLRNKRSTAALQIEMWRSINSNQKKGNI